ncbi:Malic enzyme [Colletotrichum higginsianum IMI 349063]|uniref:Malic enzyme n=2 Tax=Colletotrichum higginsianum TaxID=80884 RepID=A0A1B7YCI1_COLHI|nr:Malic enzyme [Colletotrichum higginsianum IMI 349063]OBR09757.1 Malic enzyme [Colletotrichum higginsianum IMI 349063]TID07530.1 NAD-dependent malic enzyme, mitochondrial [Colletotrichum higginsianum]GJD03224.1 malic enzyme [Colletotrichum higginsianum]
MASNNNQERKFSHLPLSTSGPISCALTGSALLNTPYLNKGTAFPEDERREFNLTGLLPQSVHRLEQQLDRAYAQYRIRPDDLAKNTFLTSLKEQNEVLYYRLLQENLPEMFSIVYTPTEGDAIQKFSHLFRRPDGCFLNINDIDRVYHDLAQWGRPEDIDYIVVTDGEEILGIGDQGVGGVLISVAKLVLTTVCAGIHPNRTLPVVLDCGTDNEGLLNDDLYLGLRQKRVRGDKYDRFVDEFVKACRRLYPRAYIHFEDFGLDNARRILDRYRPHIPCFNDDIQGTGCVTLAAIMAALHVSKLKLSDLRLVIFGAGSAGVGIADQVRDAIAAEGNIDKKEAAKQIWLVDRPGLLTNESELSAAQTSFARDSSEWKGKDGSLLEVVKTVKPNVLIGTSTKPKAFTEEIVRAMAEGVERPIILPLSNPTYLHEAVPKDIYKWTDGKALVATGSPFAPVTGPWGEEGEDIEIDVAECNNSVVFPGIGLGSVLSRASLVTDKMLVAAVQGVASLSPALEDQREPLLPGVEDVWNVSVRIARNVIKAAVEEGVATEKGIPDNDEDLDEWIREQMWYPKYRPLKLVALNEASREAKGEMKVAGSLAKVGNW